MCKNGSAHYKGSTGDYVDPVSLEIEEQRHYEDLMFFEEVIKNKSPKKTSIEIAVDEVINTMSPDGNITADSIRKNARVFSKKTINIYMEALKKLGYNVRERSSSRLGSRARIIVISNPSKTRNITQVQVSPGGGRHGDLPYIKISTSNIGKFKIIDGSHEQYRGNSDETAEIIFIGGN